jgi:Tol biopolymer transport system component
MVLRRVWGGSDVDLSGNVSADGRYLAFIDWTIGDVMVREVATGNMERVTYDGVWEPYQTAEEARISPDGKQVAYLWYNEAPEDDEFHNYELRVIRRGDREPRLLYRSPDCTYPEMWNWAPDGSEMVFLGHMEDGTNRLIAVSIDDGTTRILEDFGTLDPSRGVVSPDASYAVYAFREDENGEDRDLFVLDLGSGSTTALVRNPGDDMVLGWSPRGDHILFASDRTGILAAWMQRTEDGKAIGEPWMVKADLWRARPLGFTDGGSFFFGIPLASRKIHIASLDPETGAVLAAPAPVSGDRLGEETFPDWSPDGRFLAYRSDPARGSGMGSRRDPRIVIRSLETGESRELVPDLKGFGSFRWYPDSRRLLVDGLGQDGQGGLFEVDIETGHAEVPQELDGITAVTLIDWGPSGKELYYRIRRPVWRITQPAKIDLETGRETVLFDDEIGYAPALSPDGRFLAFGARDAGTVALMIVPTAGGSPRVLVRFEAPDTLRGPEEVRGKAWSRDGRTLIYSISGEVWEGLWTVPVAGGPPARLDLGMGDGQDPIISREIRFHPDGRRIAFDVGRDGAEVWVMENFLPSRNGRDGSR